MIVKITPDVSYLRYYLRLALGNFETLSPEQAAEGSRGDLEGLLEYLECIDCANSSFADLEMVDGKVYIGFKNSGR